MSSLQLSLDEPISPELALVCPELAERARRLLPDIVWPAPAVLVAAPARTARLHALVLTLFCLLVTVTPLVFVGLMMKAHGHR